MIKSGKYEGWYCVADETFVPELQVRKDPQNGRTFTTDTNQPVEWVSEKNYLFKLSAFKEQLRHWLEKNPDIILPNERQQQLLSISGILGDDKQTLEDLSVSRPSTRVRWALKVPNDEEHSIYVWLDALINYLTVVGFGSSQHNDYGIEFWPPDYQILGKDILTFHAIYWPAFLMAIDLQPPKHIISHAHWTVEHKKVTKNGK
jgi:methionyl-tRNA synthetase